MTSAFFNGNNGSRIGQVFDPNKVKTEIIEGKMWFSVRDICEVLEIHNIDEVILEIPDSMRGCIDSVDDFGGFEEIDAISEAGVLKLLFKYNDPDAEKILDWIVDEVLPAIRRTGSYSVRTTAGDTFLRTTKGLNQYEEKMAQINDYIKDTFREGWCEEDIRV